MKIETVSEACSFSAFGFVRLCTGVICANIASVNIAITAALLASLSINSKARTYCGKTTQCDRCHGRYQLQCTCKTVIDVCACLGMFRGKLSRHDCRLFPPPLSFYTNLCCHQTLLLLLVSVPANGSWQRDRLVTSSRRDDAWHRDVGCSENKASIVIKYVKTYVPWWWLTHCAYHLS